MLNFFNCSHLHYNRGPSIWGLTMVRYACAFTSLEQSLRLRFIKFKVLDALLTTLDMCGDHNNDLFNMIPK